MAINGYSHCPGGTGKKIKFCCHDLLSDFEQLGRMLEGDQVAGALQHVERLLAAGKPRECLLAIKTMLLRQTEQFEAAEAAVAKFLELFPDNVIARAESAILAALRDDPADAMTALQATLKASQPAIEPRVYEAIGAVADAMFDAGHWLSGCALLKFQISIYPDDKEAIHELADAMHTRGVPLLLKSTPPQDLPEKAPWTARLLQALEPNSLGRWEESLERLGQLAAEMPDQPVIWHALAWGRSWLGDDAGCAEAWRRYAALDVPQQSAVEARAISMLLSTDPLNDSVDLLMQTYAVRDPDRAAEALIGGNQVVAIPTAAASATTPEGELPPTRVGLLLDRPVPTSADVAALDALPLVLGQAMLFGRQTDREARLEVRGASADQREAIAAAISAVFGDAVAPNPDETVLGHMSATRRMLSPRHYPPRDVTNEQLIELDRQQIRRGLERWTDRPAPLFDGQTPREAVGDPRRRVDLLAALMLLDTWTGDSGDTLRQLRTALGLPPADPIDPAQQPVASIPAIRLDRLMVEKLDDTGLILALRRAMGFQAVGAMQKFARAVLDRASIADADVRNEAFAALVQTAEDLDEALAQLEHARKATIEAGRSCAAWDLSELPLRFRRGEVERAMELVSHLQTKHGREPHVTEALMRILVDVGLLRPDGTPAFGPGPAAPGVAEPPAAEPGKLWTPDSGAAPTAGGGGKLWTPD